MFINIYHLTTTKVAVYSALVNGNWFISLRSAVYCSAVCSNRVCSAVQLQ